MTTNDVKNATIVLEFNNGEYAITGTQNEAVINVCCALLQFKIMPKEYFKNYSLYELDIEGEQNELEIL